MSRMCHEYLEKVYAYLDGEMSDADCRALQAHLESCPPCMAAYQRDARLKELVRRSCACEPAPTELRERIVTYIHTSVTVVRRRA